MQLVFYLHKNRILLCKSDIKTILYKTLNHMATLNTPTSSRAVTGRTIKALPSVDLTAMVDLAFLLITFFMLTTSLSKMKALDAVKPIESEIQAPYPESRTMTILLGKKNQVAYYMGVAKNATIKLASLTTIKDQILANKLMVQKTHQTTREKRIIIIIKPTMGSVYKNFVDIIDEMNINAIYSYAIDDKNILANEKSFMEKNGI